MKCVLQVIERVSMVDGIYKDIYGWDLEYMKLLWEKVVGKYLLSEFGGRNLNEEVS